MERIACSDLSWFCTKKIVLLFCFLYATSEMALLQWHNSFSDCQAYSSSNLVGRDHRIITTKVQLSLHRPKQPSVKKLFWRALTTILVIASQIDNTIASCFNDLPTDKQDYTIFVSIANSMGSELLPSKPRNPPKTVDTDPGISRQNWPRIC